MVRRAQVKIEGLAKANQALKAKLRAVTLAQRAADPRVSPEEAARADPPAQDGAGTRGANCRHPGSRGEGLSA